MSDKDFNRKARKVRKENRLIFAFLALLAVSLTKNQETRLDFEKALQIWGRPVDSSMRPCYTPPMNMLRKAENERFKQSLIDLGRWLAPGLGIKRWFFFVMAGITLFGVGTAIFLYDLYHIESTNQTWLTILSYASLSFLPHFLRVLIFAGLGVGLVAYGIWGINRSLLRPFIRPGH